VKTLAVYIDFSGKARQELNNFVSRLKPFKQAPVASFTRTARILLSFISLLSDHYFFTPFELKQAIKKHEISILAR
jgi:hypothetical protein